MKKEKSAEGRSVIESLERETLMHIFDIYASLFPLNIKEKRAAPLLDRSVRQPSLDIISEKTVPVEAKTWKGRNGGGFGGSDGGGHDGGNSDSNGEDKRNRVLSRRAGSFSVSCCWPSVLTGIFLPEDRKPLREIRLEAQVRESEDTRYEP